MSGTRLTQHRCRCRHALRALEIVWAVRNNHIGDAFFDLDAAAFLFSEIDARGGPHPSGNGSVDAQVCGPHYICAATPSAETSMLMGRKLPGSDMAVFGNNTCVHGNMVRLSNQNASAQQADEEAKRHGGNALPRMRKLERSGGSASFTQRQVGRRLAPLSTVRNFAAPLAIQVREVASLAQFKAGGGAACHIWLLGTGRGG